MSQRCIGMDQKALDTLDALGIEGASIASTFGELHQYQDILPVTIIGSGVVKRC